MTVPGLLPANQHRQRSLTKHHEMDFAKMYATMEKGNKVGRMKQQFVQMALSCASQVCKLQVMKKWDPAYKMLTLKQDLRLLMLNKIEMSAVRYSICLC